MAEISESTLNFPKTYIFSSSQETFTLNNTGNVELNYLWDIFESEEMPSTAQRSVLNTALPFSMSKSPFIIEPKQGAIPAGKSITFTAKFAPSDMRGLNMTAACRIPNWSGETPQIEMKLVGKGLLPALHFSFPEENSEHFNTHDVSLKQVDDTGGI